MLRGLYGITDTSLTPQETLYAQVEAAIQGGMRILQLRDKISTDAQVLPIASKLLKLCRKNNVLFIVDDRIELAIEIDADGVHVGKDDKEIREFKDNFKGKIIGVSCYGDIHRALDAQEQGANYVAFGSFFPSPTKPLASLVDRSVLSQAKNILNIPICAIGGITTSNATALVDAGSDMIAVISDLWSAQDIFAKAKEFSELYEF